TGDLAKLGDEVAQDTDVEPAGVKVGAHARAGKRVDREPCVQPAAAKLVGRKIGSPKPAIQGAVDSHSAPGQAAPARALDREVCASNRMAQGPVHRAAPADQAAEPHLLPQSRKVEAWRLQRQLQWRLPPAVSPGLGYEITRVELGLAAHGQRPRAVDEQFAHEMS